MPSSSDGKPKPPSKDKQPEELPQQGTTYWPSSVPGHAETPDSGLELFNERYRLMLGNAEVEFGRDGFGQVNEQKKSKQ